MKITVEIAQSGARTVFDLLADGKHIGRASVGHGEWSTIHVLGIEDRVTVDYQGSRVVFMPVVLR